MAREEFRERHAERARRGGGSSSLNPPPVATGLCRSGRLRKGNDRWARWPSAMAHKLWELEGGIRFPRRQGVVFQGLQARP